MKIVVASTNPVKIAATEEGFRRMFPGETFEMAGVSVPSGVSDQPMGDEETYAGAHNRIKAAARMYPGAEYYVGLEGGCEDHAIGGLCAFAWVVVEDAQGKEGKGRTSIFFLPEAVASLVRSGIELGHADDQVFGRENSKQGNGAVGILTGDVTTRESYYADAVVMALIPFKNPTLY